MQIVNRKIPWYVYIAGVWLVITIMSAISAFYTKQSLMQMIAFSAYQLFAILIPGLGYTRILIKDKNISGIGTIFIAYALGYCSNIAMYYLLFFMGGMETKAGAYVLLISIQCVFSIYLLVKDKTCFSEENYNWLIPLVFVLGLYVLELFAYSGYNLLPPYTDGNNVWGDMRYWIGNTVSLKLGFPPFEFRLLRENYSYHFFSSMQLAVESIVTGIPAAELSIYFSYIQAIIILVGGLYCLLIKYIDNKISMIILFGMLLFTSGYEGITRVSYVSHLYLSQYGFDYGMGYILFLLYAMIELFATPFSWRNYSITCIFFAVLMGIKATYACIGIVGIGCICLHFLVKKEWKKSFITGFGILFIFGFLYINVCSISGYSGNDKISIETELSSKSEKNDKTQVSGKSKEYELVRTINKTGEQVSSRGKARELVNVINISSKQDEMEGDEKNSPIKVKGLNIRGVIHISKFHWDVCENLRGIRETIFAYDMFPTWILEVFFFVLFVVICNPCLFILNFFIGVAKMLKREKFDYWDISCLVMILVGMLITLYIHMYGKSNVYFAMATYPIALLFIAKNIGRKLYNRKGVWMAVSLCLLVFGMELFLNHAAYKSIMSYFDYGKEQLESISDSVNLIEESENGVTTMEYEALLYVRENVESDETILCINNRDGDFNLAGILSEHKVVNWNPDSEEAGTIEEVMRKWNTNFLVVPKHALSAIEEEGIKVFQNNQWYVIEYKE